MAKLSYGSSNIYSILVSFLPGKKANSYLIVVGLFFFLHISHDLFSQEVKKIKFVASSVEFDKNLGDNAKRLTGNVVFTHADAVMHCDSAYFYSEINLVEAFNNIHIIESDTLHLYGDYLKYNGNDKKAEVRENVKLVDRGTVLTTEFLDFDLENNVGYYFNGGHIVNGDNVLESHKGFYYSREEMFHFRDSVTIVNPDYVIYADTMKYNTISKIAYFFGPTRIISDENIIYCENGWYDTEMDISRFSKNAVMYSENQILRADSLFYNRNTGLGRAFEDVSLNDTVQNILLLGNFGEYNQKTSMALMTDSAVFAQVTEDDTIFVHADTLRSIPDTIPDKKIVKAYYKVKIFSRDIQGKCDSMTYISADSVTYLTGSPVLWSGENQLTAELIELHTANNQMDYIFMQNTAFIISKEDTLKFNQIKGRSMTGYFKDNSLSKIDVNGNGQTIYFPKDGTEVMGVNKAESSNLTILVENNDVKRIIFLTQPNAVLYPLNDIVENELILKDFVWLERFRPVKKQDIFVWENTNESSRGESNIIPEQ
jgi:lipopolysaccharide export system protein LptA